MDLRRVLYGLHAILRLHFAQEEEAYAWLASADDDASASVGRLGLRHDDRLVRLRIHHLRGELRPVAARMRGEEDAERRPAPRTLLDPRPAVVQLGEARHERQPHADARQVR